MGTQKLLPIIQVDNEKDGVNVAKAIQAAGLTTVEVVLRSDRSLQAISAIKQALPDMVVSAGTILDETILASAIDAGADFIVTPASSPQLLNAIAKANIAALPGVSNVADVLLAREHGFHELKLFPASLSGGPAMLKAVSSVFQDIRFCPTGGVNQDNYLDYFKLPNVFAVGGTWVTNAEWVAAGEWDKITQACKAVV
jgi:2-dehydro-3-deoxyphosphogluconate aldolase/(4S)-4-hydroxy-2-oxoglutarate aldolase